MGKQGAITGIDFEKLPDLSIEDEIFFQAIMAGSRGIDAYKKAYDTSNYTSKNALWTQASRKLNDPKMRLWFAAAKMACLTRGTRTREEHVQQLDRLKEIAIESGNVSAAVMAEATVGKAVGLHIDRVQEVPVNDDELLRELSKSFPAQAKELAAQAGIVLPDESIH